MGRVVHFITKRVSIPLPNLIKPKYLRATQKEEILREKEREVAISALLAEEGVKT
jgi:hypothetical protein